MSPLVGHVDEGGERDLNVAGGFGGERWVIEESLQAVKKCEQEFVPEHLRL